MIFPMARHREPYTLVKQKTTKGKTVYYYRLANDPKRTMHSTGKAIKSEARAYVEKNVLGKTEYDSLPLWDYLEPFFDWDRCPHLERIRSERMVTKRYADSKRYSMLKHIKPDPIAKIRITELRRDDILGFRSRLIKKGLAGSTVNRIVGILKTAFREGVNREILTRNPVAGVGTVRHTPAERGTFTVAEVEALFPSDSLGPWADLQVYVAFLLCASTGLRRGEVLALRWCDIHGDYLEISGAWKDHRETRGIPKGGRVRVTPFILMPDLVPSRIDELKASSRRTDPEDLVLCYVDGSRLGQTWWDGRWRAGLKKAGEAYANRNLTPHSFRHTLNSELRRRGHDPALIREALGWNSDRVQDIYTHFRIDDLRSLAVSKFKGESSGDPKARSNNSSA
jgi:integrase